MKMQFTLILLWPQLVCVLLAEGQVKYVQSTNQTKPIPWKHNGAIFKRPQPCFF